METKPKSLWSLLNPLNWLSAIFVSMLRLFGLMPPPQTGGFENISKVDLEDAEKDAREAEEAIDQIVRQMSPAEVVRAYATASPGERAEMVLTALDAEGVDWLLSLSDDDLTLLSMSTIAGCARSLEALAVKPIYVKPQGEMDAPEILAIPGVMDIEEQNRQKVAKRFRQVQRELWLSPGVANPKPKHSAFTLH